MEQDRHKGHFIAPSLLLVPRRQIWGKLSLKHFGPKVPRKILGQLKGGAYKSLIKKILLMFGILWSGDYVGGYFQSSVDGSFGHFKHGTIMRRGARPAFQISIWRHNESLNFRSSEILYV